MNSKRTILRRAVSCSLAILVFSSLPQVGATTLFGGVQHSETLPNATQSYQSAQAQPDQMQTAAPTVGTHYPQPALKGSLSVQGSGGQTPLVPAPPELPAAPTPVPSQPALKIDWYQIPNAMAGKWLKQGDLTESVTDLRTGITTPVNRFTDDELTVSWGHQVDKNGNVWHANIMPFERDGSTRGLQVRFIIVSLQAQEIAANELISRIHSIIVESQGTVVTKVFQQEALNHYYVSERQIVNRSSNRDFTYEGAPLRDGMLVSKFDKIAPFQPVPTLQGVDLARALDEYLKSKGLQ